MAMRPLPTKTSASSLWPVASNDEDAYAARLELVLPVRKEGARWRFGTYSDVATGGASSVRLHDTSRDRLRFDFKLRDVAAYPFVAGDMVLIDDKGRQIHEDWSKFRTMTFVAKCSPATSTTP